MRLIQFRRIRFLFYLQRRFDPGGNIYPEGDRCWTTKDQKLFQQLERNRRRSLVLAEN